MFCFKAALRNLKFNKLSAALTFATIFIICALMTLGLRICIPAYTAFKNSSTYKSVYEAMAYTTAIATIFCVVGGAIMLYGLVPSSSDKKKKILQIYSDIGATREQIFAINLIEMLAVSIAACPFGIVLGEAVLYSQQSWISAFAGSIEWQNGYGVWITVAVITFVMIVASCLIYYFKPGPKFSKEVIRNGAPSKLYTCGRGAVGFKLGWISFKRRRRPTSIFVMVLVCMIVVNVLCNSVSYAAEILQSEINNVSHDYSVSFTYDLYDECTEIYNHFKEKYNCVLFSSPNVRVYWTTDVTDACAEAHVTANNSDGQKNAGSNCIEMIVSDDDFDCLIEQIGAVISPNESEGMSAILVNRAYDSDNHYKQYNIFSNTEIPSYGTLETTYYLPEASAPVTVISYTDDWPAGYAYLSNKYGLIMRESDYLKYFGTLTGEYYSGMHYIRFCDADGIYDEIYNYIDDNYTTEFGRSTGSHVDISDKNEARIVKSQTITFVENYLNMMFIIIVVVLLFNMLFMLNREVKSRGEEFNIYRSLGINKRTMFAMLFTDCFLYFLTLFGIALIASVLLSLPMHWMILGYYKSFYIEWFCPLICLTALTVISFLFALQKSF